jgi:hypothetical protein
VAARRRADPHYTPWKRYEFKASRDMLKKNPNIVEELSRQVLAEVHRQAAEHGAVVTERLNEETGELELTIDPVAVVQQRENEKRKRAHHDEKRRRERDALERARRAIATPGER